MAASPMKDMELQTLVSDPSEVDEARQGELAERRTWKNAAVLLAVGLVALGAFAALAGDHGRRAPRGRLGVKVQLEGGSHAMPSKDKAWEQVQGVVEIEHVKEMLKDPSLSDERKQQLRGMLDELKANFPSHAEIKEKFADKWDEMKAGVKLEELQAWVEKAKKAGSDKLDELQAQLNSAMKDCDLDALKANAQSYWDQMPEMPDLDKLHDKVHRTATETFKPVSDAAWDKWDSFSSRLPPPPR